MREITTWPGWESVRKIGSGAYGSVYEIRREEFGVTYKAALKVITIPQNESEVEQIRSTGMDDVSVTAYFRSFVEELVAEFELMSKLKGNSNIVSYEDHMVVPHEDEIGWNILIRMELLQPLEEYFQNHEPSDEEVARLGIELNKALEVCAAYRIIHRDIKPENIFVNDLGNFKLGDFGIARTVDKTVSNMSKKGTYSYMAPEVYKEEPYSATADIYSLGIVLYRYLNNRRTPFLPAYPAPIKYSDAEYARNVRMRGDRIPPPAQGGQALQNVVLKATAYHSEDRFATASEFREALECVISGAAVKAQSVPSDTAPTVVARRSVAESDDKETVGIWGARNSAPKHAEQPAGSSGMSSERPVSREAYRYQQNMEYSVPPRPKPEPDNKFQRNVLIALSCCAIALVIVILVIIFGFGSNSTGGSLSGGSAVDSRSEVEDSTHESATPTAAPIASETPAEAEPTQTEASDFSQTVISDFERTYYIYRQWVQARSGSSIVLISEEDRETGVLVEDGATLNQVLSSAFSTRYVSGCMDYLGVKQNDTVLCLPKQDAASAGFDLMELDHQYEVIKLGEKNCQLKISYIYNNSLCETYLDGVLQGEHWVFDDDTDELAEGEYGLFGSYHAPSATPEPSPTPTWDASSGNTTVVSYMYIVNVAESAYLLSGPDADSDVVQSLPLGTEVGFIENANSTYAKVKYGSAYGYVNRSYLSSNEPVSQNTTVVSYMYIANVPAAAYLLLEPNADAEVLQTLYLGDEVGFIEYANSRYARVQYGSSYGYVNRSYLSSTKPTTTSTPRPTAASTPTPSSAFYDGYIRPTGVSASSVLNDRTAYTYEPENIFDKDESTAWVEGVSGNGVGEYISFAIPAGVEITGGMIKNGYCKNESLFFKNAAPTQLEISSGNQTCIVDVSSAANSYSISRAGYVFTLETPIISDGTVYVTISAVRTGTAYEDTCIAELWFSGS